MPDRLSNALWLVASACAAFIIQPQVFSNDSTLLTFERDVRPILKTHCFHCHGEGEKLKGGIDLRLRRFMDKKTDSGVVLIPGHPDDSLMIQLVRAGEMPKGEKKLTLAEVSILERWIAGGAKTARPEPTEVPKGFYITEEERDFWSFRPIERPPAPALDDPSRIRTPIDAFVLAKLAERHLDFAPDADKRTLIRRVYFDLLGLLPTPEETAAFLEDTSESAYDKLLDRVLASPQYGERWGRHWLDVAGYSDSNGYAEADSVRPHAWRYRDYVIRSINDDKPFDQFITEQLAGDELAGMCSTNIESAKHNPKAVELLTATGFLRMGPDGTGDGPADENLAKNQVLADTIKIVSSALLGMTVGCAQCHDHRYEPISQTDYYRIRAIFEPAYDWKHWKRPAERLVSLYTLTDRAKADAIEAEARKMDASAEVLRKELLEQVFQKELAKLPEAVREAVKVARNTSRPKRTPEQIQLLKQYPSADVQGALDLYDPEANKKVLAVQAQAAQLRSTKPAEPMVMALTEVPNQVPDTFLFARGDHEQPKAKVQPGGLEVLMHSTNSCIPVKDSALPTTGRRLAYARWLTSGRHPLVARVLVNRIWLEHFGRGIVSTPSDFGRFGERPTHPELLDWLASEFMAGGWKLKPFHKLLLSSTVYRQSSRHDASAEADPDNRFYGRMKLRRLDAETLRDSILEISGQLNPELFGPAVPIAQDGAGRVVAGQQKRDGRGDPTIVEPIGAREFRRSVYVEQQRSLPLTVLEAFDAPVMSPNCEMRPQTTVAPQSLMLLNDTFVLAQAQHFAGRLNRECPGNAAAQIRRAWQLVFQCDPAAEELSDSLRYLSDQTESVRIRRGALAQGKAADKLPPHLNDSALALASLCQALICENRFLYIE